MHQTAMPPRFMLSLVSLARGSTGFTRCPAARPRKPLTTTCAPARQAVADLDAVGEAQAARHAGAAHGAVVVVNVDELALRVALQRGERHHAAARAPPVRELDAAELPRRARPRGTGLSATSMRPVRVAGSIAGWMRTMLPGCSVSPSASMRTSAASPTVRYGMHQLGDVDVGHQLRRIDHGQQVRVLRRDVARFDQALARPRRRTAR